MKVSDNPTLIFHSEVDVVQMADPEFNYKLPRNCGVSEGKRKYHFPPPFTKELKGQRKMVDVNLEIFKQNKTLSTEVILY